MHKPFLFILAAALLSAAGSAFAERTAAQFGSGDDALSERIRFPELKGDTTAVLRCAARVQTNGKMKDNGCYTDSPADSIFIEEINRAARKARLTPATADERSYEVYLQYRVRFVKEGEDGTVDVWLNPGVQENIEAYGEDHVAAQRAIGEEQWQDICPERAEYLVWLKAHVAADGTQSSLSLTHGSGLNPSPRCRDAILDSADESLFFPALADGEPVPSTYVEPYGN